MRGLTYARSGVDIRKAASFKERLKPLVKRSFSPQVIKGIGGFGSLFGFAKDRYREPVLVSSTDGVGTKLKLAILADKHDTVGIDAVAMNVNDILCTGAEPLFFLDYISCGKLCPQTMLAVVKGISRGCVEAGCSLIGGETAEMPGMYRPGEYDIAGFCVGAVERKKIIDGSSIEPGDSVIGLASSGLHSNGYSLVRKAFSQKELKRMSRQLLTPTRIYVKPVLSILKNFPVKGIAHITGGAFYDKISRILADNVNVRINKSSWSVPEIFRLIQNKGGVAEKEMYHTLNMGIGMVLIVEGRFVKSVIAMIGQKGLRSWLIGGVTKGKGQVEVI